jgi:hypothetical protein
MKNKPAFLQILKKGIMYLLPLYLLWILYIETMPMYYNRPTNNRWYFLKESLNGKYKIPKINKIFLGESRLNAGINFSEIPNSYSFASGGSTPIEMYYVLKKYLRKYPKPDTVFLSVSPRFFSEIFAFWHFAVRNKVVTGSDIDEILSLKKKGETSLGRFPMLNFYLYKADYLSYYQSDVLYNYVFGGYSKNKKMIHTMMKMHGGRPHPGLKDSCSDLNHETKYAHFIPAPLLDTYFNKILNVCSRNKIKLIFFSMPVNKSSFDRLKPDFISEYEIFMKNYAYNYPNFSISDSLYSFPDIFFGDASHLNKKGKERFTKEFLSVYFK